MDDPVCAKANAVRKSLEQEAKARQALRDATEARDAGRLQAALKQFEKAPTTSKDDKPVDRRTFSPNATPEH